MRDLTLIEMDGAFSPTPDLESCLGFEYAVITRQRYSYRDGPNIGWYYCYKGNDRSQALGKLRSRRGTWLADDVDKPPSVGIWNQKRREWIIHPMEEAPDERR
jgi:hypothetical protein